MKKKITRWQCKCEHCGKEWITRNAKPTICPNCKRANWNEKREEERK